MKKLSSSGFLIIELILACVFVGLVGGIAFYLYEFRIKNIQPVTSEEPVKSTTQKEAETTKPSLKICPDEWIENRAPREVGDNSPNQYFIIKGERQEIKNYDVEWIKNNCSTKPRAVY